MNGDVGDGFHAAPLEQTARRRDVAPWMAGVPHVAQSVSVVLVVTSVSHYDDNQNRRLPKPPQACEGRRRPAPTQSRQRLDSATIPGYCASPIVRPSRPFPRNLLSSPILTIPGLSA